MIISSVLVLEDYEAVRTLLVEALTRAFGEVRIVEAETVAQARAATTRSFFDLAVLDLNLPDGSGIEVIRAVRQLSPDTLCVVATVSEDDANLFESLKAGAHGYLLKQEPRSQLIRHLEGILHGQPPLSPSMAARVIAYFSQPVSADQPLEINLTERETEVLRLIAMGSSRKQIARDLDISLHTANDHVKAVYRKLNVSSSVDAARIAIRAGLSL